MNELIQVAPREIGDTVMLTADARELHAYLGPDTDFNVWMTRRIAEYGFEEGKDFQSFLGESTGGRPPKEYTLALNMAKELSMVERTARGKEARQYFIDCEARTLACTPAILAPTSVKPTRTRRAPTSDRVRAMTLVTREIARVPGVRPEAAASAFLAMVERDTGLPVTELRNALPATPSVVAFQLNPTHLAKRLEIEGIKAGHVNLALIALGFQEEGERDYVVTAKGAEYGEMRSYTNQHNGHQGYQSAWSTAVVPLLQTYFAQHPDAALPIPKQPRKLAHKKQRHAPEPQGALL